MNPLVPELEKYYRSIRSMYIPGRTKGAIMRIIKLFLGCILTASSLAPGIAQTIDFEPSPGFNPSEGSPLDNAYMANEYGITFHLESLGGIPPIVSRTGNPRTAFANSTPFLGCGSMASNDDCIYDEGTDCFFITDDGLLAPVTYDLYIDYLSDSCCYSASGELLDVDQGEGWIIDVFSPGQSNPVATYSLCAGGGCDFPAAGDGIRSLWDIDIFPNTIDYLRFSYSSTNGPVAVGIGFDNFSFCGDIPPSTIITESVQLCDVGSPYFWRGIEIDSQGIYIDSSQYVTPCDTIYELTANADTMYTQSSTQSCNVEDTVFQIFVYSLPNGCDSIHTLITIPVPPDTISGFVNNCNPSLEGLDTMYSIMTDSCDVIFVGSYILRGPDTTNVEFMTCDPDSVGLYTLELFNSYGCDSVIMTEFLLAGPMDPIDTLLYSCMIRDTIVDTLVFQTTFGCDSIVVNTTIPFMRDTSTYYLSTCDTSLAGTDSILVFQAVPCDSVVRLVYELMDPDTSYVFSSTCDPAEADTVVSVYQNIHGCDSVVVHEMVHERDTVFSFSIDYSCDIVDTLLELTTGITLSGCDSVHTNITYPLAADSIFRFAQTCDPTVGGTDSIIIHQNAEGCDSIIFIEFELLEGDTTYERIRVCDPLQAGLDTIQWVNQAGCDSLVIRESTYHPLTVELVPDTTVFPGSPVLLEVFSDFIPADIRWTPTGPNATEWLITPAMEETYMILLVDSFGCSASDFVQIRLLDRGDIYIPNAFSPNGDGINDTWQVYATSGIQIIHIEIFERWGNKVFETGFNETWDGSFHDKPLEPNLFVGIISYRQPGGEVQIAVSEIYLMK